MLNWLKSENKNSRMNIILKADSSIQRKVWLETFLTVCALFEFCLMITNNKHFIFKV